MLAQRQSENADNLLKNSLAHLNCYEYVQYKIYLDQIYLYNELKFKYLKHINF